MDLKIVRFTKADLAFGMELTDSEEWNRGMSDWRRLLLLEPEGFFKAVLDGEEAGIIGMVRYDRVAWINSLVVRTGFRGMHVGEALMVHCLDHAMRSGATTIKLDSVRGVEPFYERFGFRTEFPSLRFLGNVRENVPPPFEVFRPRLQNVLRFDHNEVGINRGRILELLYHEPGGHCFACGDRSEITGYLLTRPARGRVDLGPCVVRGGEPELAEGLLRSATASIGSDKFKLCVPGNNVRIAGMLRAIGFGQMEGPTRMLKGVPLEEPPSMVTMMSPEKG